MNFEEAEKIASLIPSYILDDNNQVVRTDILTAAMWDVEHPKRRIVAQDDLGKYWLSTVFLTVDCDLHHMLMERVRVKKSDPNYKPLIFETMAFSRVGGVNDRTCDRYRSWDEAVKGHAYWKDVYEKRTRM